MKKLVVKKFVAEWFEKNKGDLEYSIWEYIYNWNEKRDSQFKTWMNYTQSKPIETLIKMKDGYEVEEDYYFVLIPDEYSSFKYKFLDSKGSIECEDYLEDIEKLTEKQIKAIDERFMPFAINVDDKEAISEYENKI